MPNPHEQSLRVSVSQPAPVPVAVAPVGFSFSNPFKAKWPYTPTCPHCNNPLFDEKRKQQIHHFRFEGWGGGQQYVVACNECKKSLGTYGHKN